MKKLTEMQFAKASMLSEIELNTKAGYRVIGNGTNYYGSGHGGGGIATYLDGMPIGSDGTSGSLFGDRWNLERVGSIPMQAQGVLANLPALENKITIEKTL